MRRKKSKRRRRIRAEDLDLQLGAKENRAVEPEGGLPEHIPIGLGGGGEHCKGLVPRLSPKFEDGRSRGGRGVDELVFLVEGFDLLGERIGNIDVAVLDVLVVKIKSLLAARKLAIGSAG